MRVKRAKRPAAPQGLGDVRLHHDPSITPEFMENDRARGSREHAHAIKAPYGFGGLVAGCRTQRGREIKVGHHYWGASSGSAVYRDRF